MWCEITKVKGTWHEVANEARLTIGLKPKDEDFDLSTEWKRGMLLCEHSPIRLIEIKATWHDLLWWVHTHFANRVVC
jgi:hypothetical protein